MTRLALSSIRKSYAARVLDGVDFDLRPGEVHALLGANGAGKTTLARIVAGLARPDGGAMALDGRPFTPSSKADAERSGVQIVQQELNLFSTLSVGENLYFSSLPTRRGRIDRAKLASRARVTLARVGLTHLDPTTPLSRLGLGIQQLVEIAKALAQYSRVLILDEPTAALTDPQVETLFEEIRRLVQEGTGVLYVTHRLEEMRRIADRATVLRDGKVVASDAVSRLTSSEIVRAMAGAEVERESKLPPRSLGGPALRVERLTAKRGRVRDVSFTVRCGEIFGISGLAGSGRTSLLRAIFGADRAASGGVAIGESNKLRRFRQPRKATRSGLAMIPEDRKTQGLLLPQSIELNVTLPVLKRIDRESWAHVAEGACDRIGVQRRSLEQPVRELSGGNQQKVVIARWLLRDADVFLLDEPTRGIDASARATIYRLLHELAESGKAIVLASSDLEELTSVCDRIAVLSQGKLAGIFERGSWSREELTGASLQ